MPVFDKNRMRCDCHSCLKFVKDAACLKCSKEPMLGKGQFTIYPRHNSGLSTQSFTQYVSVDQVRCSKHSMAALQAALSWVLLHQLGLSDSPDNCRSKHPNAIQSFLLSFTSQFNCSAIYMTTSTLFGNLSLISKTHAEHLAWPAEPAAQQELLYGLSLQCIDIMQA